MKTKLLFFVFALSISFASFAQNIVPNPDFSLKHGCPNISGEIDSCMDWHGVGAASPDYFNRCADSTTWYGATIFVPGNLMGNQDSRKHCYMGVYSYDGHSNYREYFGVTIPALTVGATYTVTMYVSLGDSVKYATQGLGVYFYNNAAPSDTITQIINFTPQISYTSYGAITESVNWKKLSATFVPDSAYTKLVIGNFLQNTALNITTVNPAGHDYSYYYIDSVAVEKPSNVAVPTVTPDKSATIFPNPFSNTATILFNNTTGANYTLSVYNLQGQLVRKTEDITTGSAIIEKGNLTTGSYFYQLRSSAEIINGRMVIE